MNPIVYFALSAAVWLFFAVSFFRQKRAYKLLLLIWIGTTWLSYVSGNTIFLNALGLVQLVLFFLVLFFLFHRKNTEKTTIAKMLDDCSDPDTDVMR